MERSFISGLILLLGIALLAAALAVHAILLEPSVWTTVPAIVGAVLMVWGLVALRRDIGALLHRRRTEIALYALGMVGVLLVVAYLSVLYPLRFDLTDAGLHSLSKQTIAMLKRLEKPVHIVFFHDPLLRATVELYELIAAQTPLVTVDFYDPMINPAQARMRSVQFAGTAVLESDDRTMQVHGGEEVDIAQRHPAHLARRQSARLFPRRPWRGRPLQHRIARSYGRRRRARARFGRQNHGA